MWLAFYIKDIKNCKQIILQKIFLFDHITFLLWLHSIDSSFCNLQVFTLSRNFWCAMLFKLATILHFAWTSCYIFAFCYLLAFSSAFAFCYTFTLICFASLLHFCPLLYLCTLLWFCIVLLHFHILLQTMLLFVCASMILNCTIIMQHVTSFT